MLYVLATKGAVCAPADTDLADACAVTKHKKCRVFLPSIVMHTHATVPAQLAYG
jgi:hypothetical protein